MSQTPSKTLKETGAPSDALLIGITRRNMGLVIRVYNQQAAGEGGRIHGPFDLIHWGSGTYAPDVLKLWHQSNQTFASVDEFIHQLQLIAPRTEFTHGLNANGLWVLDAAQIADRVINVDNGDDS